MHSDPSFRGAVHEKVATAPTMTMLECNTLNHIHRIAPSNTMKPDIMESISWSVQDLLLYILQPMCLAPSLTGCYQLVVVSNQEQ